MSGVISVVGRLVGAEDIAWGQNSYVSVDINGVARRINQVNAGDIPFESLVGADVQDLVNGSKSLPLGASSLGVVNTSIFSGPVYCSAAISGYVKNYASGLLQFGQSIATADIPSGIPASSVGSGIVNDEEFGYLDGATSNIQAQLGALSNSIGGMAGTKYFQPKSMPRLTYVGTGTLVVKASTTNQARVIMNGFPNVVNPDLWVVGGTASALTNGKYYQVNSDTIFDIVSNIWGTEKSSQWYAIMATCASATAELGAFILKGMPYLRVLSDASQVISTGTNLDATTAIDYGFTNDEFAGGKVYVLASATAGSTGEIRNIEINRTAAGSSTITYSGGDLQLKAGDWVIVLPPGLNFRWLGDVYNSAGGTIVEVDNLIHGRSSYLFTAVGTSTWFCPFAANWNSGYVTGAGGGAGGILSSYVKYNASSVFRQVQTMTQGTVYSLLVGAGGASGGVGAGTGHTTFLGSVLTLRGGDPNLPGNAAGLFGKYGYAGFSDDSSTYSGKQGVLLIERSTDAAF